MLPPRPGSCCRISIYKLLYVMAIIRFVVTFCGILRIFGLQSLKKPRRVCVRRRKKLKSFFTATCAWGKIPLRLPVWNLFACGEQIMRAADCNPFGEKNEVFSPAILPLILALFLGQNQCQRLNGHLQHGVVGLKGGKILQPHPRCRQRSGEGIVMAAHEAVELIGQATPPAPAAAGASRCAPTDSATPHR